MFVFQKSNILEMKRFLLNILKILFLLLLPFVVLIRGAVFLHEQYALYAWFAIFGGVMASAFLILLYAIYIQGALTGELGNFQAMKRRYWMALVVVLVYCLPGLLFLSATNAKHPEVQKEFRNLHPILRLGVSTLIWLDNDLVMTDGSRRPEDYGKMGLARKRHSLHYQQSNGYAHAIDIRTIEQGMIRNWLIERYFRLMGFQTLRHVGTADHLHVSLLSHDRPGGI